jgi:hypothetical protein
VADLATKQHGVVAHRQLIRIGFATDAIDYRLAAGRLHRVHKGVYAVGRPSLEVHGRWMAAVLACGRGAMLSHLDAAALWDLLPITGREIHVTARRSRSGAPGIRVHRVRALHAEDRARIDGIPVTSLARTLLDSAEVRPDQLERAFEEAERRRVLDVRAIERLCARANGRRGVRPLRGMIASEATPGTSDTRSELERRLLGLCMETELPLPAMNVMVEGFEVDAFWPSARLAVELDGFEFHRTRAAFERDRKRDAALQLAGHRIIRLTHRRMEHEPVTVIEELRSLLALR